MGYLIIMYGNVGYGIATQNADKNAKQSANFITERNGGERAVVEACLHVLEKFLNRLIRDVDIIKSKTIF